MHQWLLNMFMRCLRCHKLLNSLSGYTKITNTWDKWANSCSCSITCAHLLPKSSLSRKKKKKKLRKRTSFGLIFPFFLEFQAGSLFHCRKWWTAGVTRPGGSWLDPSDTTALHDCSRQTVLFMNWQQLSGGKISPSLLFWLHSLSLHAKVPVLLTSTSKDGNIAFTDFEN